MALLTNKTIKVEGCWHAPVSVLRGHKSIVMAELFNTSSSSGDWDGMFIQVVKYKLKTKRYVIPFWQENKFPSNHFELHTGEVFVITDHDITKKELENIYDHFVTC